MKISKFTLLILPLLFFACKKDPPIDPEPTEPVMPPLTHQGLNTFGCYIDGELYVANEGDSYWSIPPVSGGFNENSKYLKLQGTRYINFETGESDDLKMLAYITGGIGEYNFDFDEGGGTKGYMNWYGGKCRYYYREYPGFDIGKLTITHLDETENIISGTFYINLVNENCDKGDTLMKITDGRFDFRY